MDSATTLNGFTGLWLAVGILFSLVNCFFGFRLQRVWIGVICFLIGFVTMNVLGVNFSLNTAVAVLLGVVLGAVLAFISYKLYLAGVFIFTLGITLLCCVLLIPVQWACWTVGVLLGILLGVLAVKFTRPIMILVTGVSGGLSAAKSLTLLIPISFIQASVWTPVILGAVLAAIGAAFQFSSTKKHQKTRAAVPHDTPPSAE